MKQQVELDSQEFCNLAACGLNHKFGYSEDTKWRFKIEYEKVIKAFEMIKWQMGNVTAWPIDEEGTPIFPRGN